MILAIEIGQVVHDFAIIMIVAGAMAIISIVILFLSGFSSTSVSQESQ